MTIKSVIDQRDAELYLWRIRGPWTNDDWLLASEAPAAEQESLDRDVSIVYWETES